MSWSDRISGAEPQVGELLDTPEFADIRAVLARADLSEEAVEMFLLGVALTIRQYSESTRDETDVWPSLVLHRSRALVCRHRS